MLVLEGLVGLHRTVQFQLIQVINQEPPGTQTHVTGRMARDIIKGGASIIQSIIRKKEDKDLSP